MEFHARRWGLAIAVAATACSFNSSGFGDTGRTDEDTRGDTSTGPSPTTSTTTTPTETSSATESTTEAMTGSTTGSATTSTSGAESTGTIGDDSTGPIPVTAHSCAELLAMDPGTPTGVHSILDSDDIEYDAFCLMDFDNGGWTLVARSLAGAQATPFGWRSQRGSLDDQGDAYSLDASTKGLEFTEILVADRMVAQNVPFEHAYRLGVSSNFIADFDNSAVAHDAIGTILGDCDPEGGPNMLGYLGYTEEDDQFFFRDNMGNDFYGLRADGWMLLYNDCDLGAGFFGSQGLVYVR